MSPRTARPDVCFGRRRSEHDVCRLVFGGRIGAYSALDDLVSFSAAAWVSIHED